jgi:hypothetical protein
MNLRILNCAAGVGALTLISPTLLHAADIVADISQPNIITTSFGSQISWSAILAGLVVALALDMAFNTLGIGIGAASIDAFDRNNPTKNVPMILLVWMFVSGLAALFIGGAISGALAGVTPSDGAIHGVIAWALAAVVTLFLGMTSAGYAIGGLFRILGEGVSTVARSAAAVVPGAAQMARDLITDNAPSIDWKSIKRDAERLFAEVEEEAKMLVHAGGNDGDHHEMDHHRNQLKYKHDREDVLEMIEKSYSVVRDALNSKDRDALKDAMVSQMGVSEDIADAAIKKWDSSYTEAKRQYESAVTEMDKTARESADLATKAISQVAVWTFASLMFGMLIAGLGGYVGSTIS